MKKIHASSSGFVKGRLVIAAYDSGCLRSLLIKSQGYRTDIDAKYKDLGERNEQRYEAKLKTDGIPYQRESSVSYPLNEAGSVVFSGRRDFVCGGGVDREIVELKATSSKTKLQLMREGKYVTDNLAQLVAYMVEADADKGRLIYSYYKNPTDATPHLEREYHVTVDAGGDILVDGRHSGFTIADYLLHRNNAADAVLNGTVYDRPLNHDAPFGSPCSYCPFKRACDNYDAGSEPLLAEVAKLGLVPLVKKA